MGWWTSAKGIKFWLGNGNFKDSRFQASRIVVSYTPIYYVQDTVILAINCAEAAKSQLERHLHAKRSLQFSVVDRHFSCGFDSGNWTLSRFTWTVWCSTLLLCRCHSFMWSLLAVSIASLSTFFYVTFQFSYKLHSIGSHLWMSNVVSRIFTTTCTNVHIRRCQILYWPIILQERDMR